MLAIVATLALGQVAASAAAEAAYYGSAYGSVELEWINSTCVSEKIGDSCDACSDVAENMTAAQDCYECLEGQSDALQDCTNDEIVSDACFQEAKGCIIDDCVYSGASDMTTCIDDCFANSTGCSDTGARDDYEEVEVLNGTCAMDLVNQYCPICTSQDSESVAGCLSCIENNTEVAQTCVDSEYISDECYQEASSCIFDNCTAETWDTISDCADTCIYSSSSCDMDSNSTEIERGGTTSQTSVAVEANGTSSEIWNETCIENILTGDCSLCIEDDAEVGSCIDCLGDNSEELYSCLNSDFINETCYITAGDCTMSSCSDVSWDNLTSCVNECIASTSSCPEIEFEDTMSSEKEIDNLSTDSNSTANLTESSVNMTCLQEAVEQDCSSECIEAGSNSSEYASEETLYSSNGCMACVDESVAVDMCMPADSSCMADQLIQCLVSTCGTDSWDSECGTTCEENCAGDSYFSSGSDYSASGARRLRGN
ncbi:Hypothetical Protein FCC1311_007962 [Hondaea fermentalgiana]|uniref:Uncharacterized protein n=1 Tax=Hondaea fermentalgiana TaxID=2315210 RepID=A0A2R5G0M1_9STRA|nr:Hypothetical Protein FCC1311_007962 [Hondaea fermentalgiana]|eukprot:GBG24577.1 Hypothetical Protein FCC1311_007962 [Hondaea fermentalgiana]